MLQNVSHNSYSGTGTVKDYNVCTVIEVWRGAALGGHRLRSVRPGPGNDLAVLTSWCCHCWCDEVLPSGDTGFVLSDLDLEMTWLSWHPGAVTAGVTRCCPRGTQASFCQTWTWKWPGCLDILVLSLLYTDLNYLARLDWFLDEAWFSL